MRDFAVGENIELTSEITSLEEKLGKLRTDIFSGLSRWQRVQLARHPKRPYTLDYIKLLTTDFVELHGDRNFADDKAMVDTLQAQKLELDELRKKNTMLEKRMKTASGNATMKQMDTTKQLDAMKPDSQMKQNTARLMYKNAHTKALEAEPQFLKQSWRLNGSKSKLLAWISIPSTISRLKTLYPVSISDRMVL